MAQIQLGATENQLLPGAWLLVSGLRMARTPRKMPHINLQGRNYQRHSHIQPNSAPTQQSSQDVLTPSTAPGQLRLCLYCARPFISLYALTFWGEKLSPKKLSLNVKVFHSHVQPVCPDLREETRSTVTVLFKLHQIERERERNKTVNRKVKCQVNSCNPNLSAGNPCRSLLDLSF